MSPGIAAVGAYAPRTRLPGDAIAEAWGQFKAGGIEETAVPGADEDVLTMGYEAARNALDAGELTAGDVGAVAFATTNPPVEEESLLPRFAAMLGVSETAESTLYTGSLTVGVRALRGATRAVESTGPVLVVASDAPRGALDEALEQGAGAGAAAFVVTADGPATLDAFATVSEPAVGTRFRQRGNERSEGLGITPFDRETFETTVTGALERLAYDEDAVDAVAVQATDGRQPYRVAGALPVSGERLKAHATVHTLGDTGAASVPLSLATALADDASGIVGIAAGSGAIAEAVTVDVADTVPTALALDGETDVDYATYLRQRGEITGGEPQGGGGYVTLPTWHRSLAQRYRLEAGRCPSCERLNMPPQGACSHCRALVEYEPVELARTGTVEACSVISQGGAPPEFAELQGRAGAYATGIVAFDGPDGGSASLPALFVEVDPDDVAVGDEVERTIRKIYTQEGVTRYGFKVRPAV
ncbi:zinc ribbon domain-containing protein [Halorarius litoreus]|uniref:zinc ribbon domain-containing protein n=1 Tax=Halorarius litoreus TaxID=2962676 RepID=UPI0020CE1680|nr:zinc ribbon domain-containing protein [Halorarius litoreus]